MIMKKIFLISAVGLALTSTMAVAQQKQDKGERITRADAKNNAEARANRLADKMNTDLSLSEDQKAQVHSVALKHFSNKEATVESRKKFNEEIEQVLTVEQKAKKAELDKKKVDEMLTDKPMRTETIMAPEKVMRAN